MNIILTKPTGKSLTSSLKRHKTKKVGEYGAFMKGSNFEIDTRAPLIINCPGKREKSVRTNALVEFVDIYPSVCELMGMEKPSHLQGTSFNALWEKSLLTSK